MVEALNSDLESHVTVRSNELKGGLENFRKIVTVANEGIVLMDADLRIVYANDAMAKMLRGTPKEILGLDKIEFIPVSERQKFHDRVLKRKEGQAGQVQFPIRLLDGETRWMQVSSAPIMDENNRFQGLVAFFTDIHDRKRERDELAAAYEEINSLKQQLEADNLYLQDEIKEELGSDMIIGESDVMKYTFFRMNQVAGTDATVIVLGETGTGKELLVRALHSASLRSQRPLIKVDCAAMHNELIESELFGHVKGAFTGADQKRTGRFELAHKGTLFLDEIGELPLASQAKLLRFLQEGEFERVGDSRTIKCDVRIIAATNRDIPQLIKEGGFRQDLWHRLKVFPITLPPLRDRKEDIPLLVNHFINKIGKRIGKEIKSIPGKTIEQLTRYDWPGNIRELEHVLERALILSHGSRLVLAEKLINESHQAAADEMMSHSEMERRHIVRALERTRWVVEGPKGAARILKLHPNTLRYRMKKHNISRPE